MTATLNAPPASAEAQLSLLLRMERGTADHVAFLALLTLPTDAVSPTDLVGAQQVRARFRTESLARAARLRTRARKLAQPPQRDELLAEALLLEETP